MDGSEYVPEDERADYREWVRVAAPNPELDAQIEAWIERDNLRELVQERLSQPGARERLLDIIARNRKPPTEPLHVSRARIARWEAAWRRAQEEASDRPTNADVKPEDKPKDKRKPYDVNDPDRVRAPAGVPPEALEHAASIILAARARRLARPDHTDSGD